MGRHRMLVIAAYVAPVIVFLMVYVPAAGHGFISDDFVWILHNRVRTLADLGRVVTTDNGFYRPTVALSFTVNEMAFGLQARAYGLTNVAFALVCGGSIFFLCRAVRLPAGAAAFGAALWLLNLHGINMSVLWISGRTALLATAAAAGCAAAVLYRRPGIAAVLLALAVTSREDAVLLPIVTCIWVYVLGGRESSIRRLSVWFLVSITIVVCYFAARSTTDAMTPATAPAYYRFTASPASLARNALEYADRTTTVAAAALVVLAIVLRPRWRFMDPESRRLLMCSVVWLIAFLIPALLLPVRSSLYACLPSVGPCVAVAAIGHRWWVLSNEGRRRQALIAAIVVPFLLWPVYRARTERWVGMAEFSTSALVALRSAAASLPEDSDILIVDDRSRRANMASVFSTMLRDAFLLTSGRYMTFYVDPPIPNAPADSGGVGGCEGCEDARLVVRDGQLSQ